MILPTWMTIRDAEKEVKSCIDQVVQLNRTYGRRVVSDILDVKL